MSELGISPALLSVLGALVEERTGIHYDDQDRELFVSKVRARAVEAGFDSPLDYYYCLRYDDPSGREFDALAETLVVGETYFFRETRQLEVLIDLLEPAIASGRRPRLWCAASASGEEPLTLAMLLAERGLLANVQIVASDLSTRALSRAREGVYGARSLRSTSELAKQRWFESVGERMSVRKEIRAAIDWRRVNLVDAEAVRALGTFDAVLCRNVLIYFADEGIQKTAGVLAGALREDGLLLVGTSESLLRYGTIFVCEEHGGSFFYRKAS